MSVVYPQCVQTQSKSDQSDHTTSTADPEVGGVGTISDRLRGLLYTEPDTLQIWGPPGGLWASWPLGSPGASGPPSIWGVGTWLLCVFSGDLELGSFKKLKIIICS